MKKRFLSVSDGKSGAKPGKRLVSRKVVMALCVTALMVAICAQTVFASSFGTPVQIKSNVNADSSMGALVGAIRKLFTLVGGALGAWGVGMFALAVKNEEPESKQKAIMCILAGIVLMSLKIILTSVGIIG